MRQSLDDPAWFPADYLPETDAFRLVPVDLQTLSDAAFLDRRMTAAWHRAIDVPAQTAIELPLAPPALLFHTAFCGSTLLARALHFPPRSIALREPLVLHTLSMHRGRVASAEARSIVDRRLHAALALLSRPWAPGGRVLIKPANQANPLLQSILHQSPDSRAILLYSGLREFMLSCFKKLPEAEERIRWMAQSLLAGSRLAAALGVDPSARFNLVESCALAWYSQIERYADALAADARDHLRTLDMNRMLDEPLACVQASAAWLGLETADLAAHVHSVFTRNAKSTDKAFDAGERERQKEQVADRYGEIIERGLAWAEADIAPAASLPVAWKALELA